MKKWFFVPILCLFLVVCLKPERDNEYDKYNPSMAYVGGTVYDFNGSPLEGAMIKLSQESELIVETTSDEDGWYKLAGLEPGIYKLIAEAEFYTPVHIGPIDLKEGDHIDTLDIYFQEIFFDFENDPVGESNPYGWHVESGHWEIITDIQQPDKHSVPNVYAGTNAHDDFEASLTKFKEPLRDFWVDTKVKIINTTGPWATGIVLRYQDQDNFYILRIEPPGQMSLAVLVNDSLNVLAVNNSLDFRLNTWYCLAADFHGNDIEIYLDEQLIFELSDNTFQQGYLGLWIQSFDPGGNVGVGFDDVGIWP